ncbi:uncharacterized protein LOC113345063 isoform X2 [Papaver somniferum]|uniref:uncharacterized protein LOC113345063 isoform X2 n=1 Tax=Papaver somniferum TaxID=3469 RepID=UPI000E6FE805|nr:uncharacterized protein LOC113345063 isoform X2 [Papaver somniferum]
MIQDSKGSLSIFKNGDRRPVPAADDEIMEVPEVDTSVRSLTVMWDGSLVVAANNNKTCYVWRLQRGTQTMTNFEPLHKLQAHDGYILKCLHSPGQIARVAIIFRVNEVVIFENNNGSDYDLRLEIKEDDNGNESGTQFLIRILKYLETPRYLRHALLQMHISFRSVGLLPPLDDPHHLRKHEWVHIGKVSFVLHRKKEVRITPVHKSMLV